MSKKNPRIRKLVKKLKQKSHQEGTKIWKDIAERLEKPRSNYSEVNISKINRHVKEGEDIIVPGKVLGSGRLEKPVNIAALDFSDTAITKIKQADGEHLSIEELIQKNPKGSGITIIG
ncbi:MAG: Ribosomal protein L18E [Candidatus Methanohalarchaeum thermophilum]|uniref:Large ribosomal subunit protein eL18 n=1 Tax=Methanohalarchaeum thermophilum TaxID=1903181 RepID=A0A1Q6DS16_METT1|nr:MAG: Ribosomal protein L18E [Candidatus Methanohalarchaeum thermophilum]